MFMIAFFKFLKKYGFSKIKNKEDLFAILKEKNLSNNDLCWRIEYSKLALNKNYEYEEIVHIHQIHGNGITIDTNLLYEILDEKLRNINNLKRDLFEKSEEYETLKSIISSNPQINKNQYEDNDISIEGFSFCEISEKNKLEQPQLLSLQLPKIGVNKIETGKKIPQVLSKEISKPILIESNEQSLQSTLPLHQKEEISQDIVLEITEIEDKIQPKNEQNEQNDEKEKESMQQEILIEVTEIKDEISHQKNEISLEIKDDTLPSSSIRDEISITDETPQAPLVVDTIIVTIKKETPNKKLLVLKQSDFFPNMIAILQSKLKGVTVQEVKDFSKFGLNDNSHGVGEFENVFVLYAVSCTGARTDSESDAIKIKSIRLTIGNKVPIIYGVFIVGTGPTRIECKHTQGSIIISHSMSDFILNLQNNENLKKLESLLQ
ncbi:hypothetical protein ACTFIV_008495 [Dictyostelium citrinum]